MRLMPRALLLLVVLSALALGAFLALGRDGAQANPDPVITVNSTADTNTRDSVMTLREAILLATGDLSLENLTEGECLQVSPGSWDPFAGACFAFDTPGAASADTIAFDLSFLEPGSPRTIIFESQPPDLDTGNDTVNGSAAGVIVTGPAWVCFFILSDGNTIKGLQIVNCAYGVYIVGDDNAIGGSTPADRNVISGNTIGVAISTSKDNSIKGNLIGTDANGTGSLPNTMGVRLDGGSQFNQIGGSSAAERNVISGNSVGVDIANPGTSFNSVRGNYIGTNAAGTAPLPNETGVSIADGAQDNYIGGTGGSPPSEGNVIAFNSGDGVRVNGATARDNVIRGNSIHSNGGKGVENVNGGNGELAPPAVTGFGSVMGTACANCAIDVYSDDEDEGRVYEGSTTADGAGAWTFSGSPEGPNVTAAAIDVTGNTSEFSVPIAIVGTTPTTTPTPTPTATPGATPTPSAGASRTLQWGAGWNNATWSGAGGAAPQDVFACAAGKYAAAYRYAAGGLERFFPDRPDISNMQPLAQYDAFLILVTEPVTCTMPAAPGSPPTRTLQWGAGWNNAGWSGPDGTPPDQDFACADGSYAAAYRYVVGGLERYFPGRADISNMAPLNKYDAFLILVTAPVNCAMPVAS